MIPVKLIGPVQSRRPLPLKCKFCGRTLRPTGRKSPLEICNRCRRRNLG